MNWLKFPKKFVRILLLLIETFVGKITAKALITATNSTRLLRTNFVA